MKSEELHCLNHPAFPSSLIPSPLGVWGSETALTRVCTRHETGCPVHADDGAVSADSSKGIATEMVSVTEARAAVPRHRRTACAASDQTEFRMTGRNSALLSSRPLFSCLGRQSYTSTNQRLMATWALLLFKVTDCLYSIPAQKLYTSHPSNDLPAFTLLTFGKRRAILRRGPAAEDQTEISVLPPPVPQAGRAPGRLGRALTRSSGF